MDFQNPVTFVSVGVGIAHALGIGRRDAMLLAIARNKLEMGEFADDMAGDDAAEFPTGFLRRIPRERIKLCARDVGRGIVVRFHDVEDTRQVGDEALLVGIGAKRIGAADIGFPLLVARREDRTQIEIDDVVRRDGVNRRRLREHAQRIGPGAHHPLVPMFLDTEAGFREDIYFRVQFRFGLAGRDQARGLDRIEQRHAAGLGGFELRAIVSGHLRLLPAPCGRVDNYSAASSAWPRLVSAKLMVWRYLMPSSAMSSPTMRSPSALSSSMFTYMP